MVCTAPQGIQLHLHFKLKIQNSGEMEVLFLMWKQWRLQGGRTQQRHEEIQFGPSGGNDIPTATSLSPVSRHFGSVVKSPSPRNCKFIPVGFCFSSSGKGVRGAKTDGSCQPAQKWDASGGVLFMEMFRSNNHRRSLISIGEGEFDSCVPVLPSFKHLP